MAKKRKGHEIEVRYGTAGTTGSTQITPNLIDADPGIGGHDYVDRPTRGSGSGIPCQDEQPVKKKAEPKFSLEYHDGDTHCAALIAAADANPPVGKAIAMRRYNGGTDVLDIDCYLEYSCPGPIGEGQKIEFTCHPTTDYGRTGLPVAA